MLTLAAAPRVLTPELSRNVRRHSRAGERKVITDAVGALIAT